MAGEGYQNTQTTWEGLGRPPEPGPSRVQNTVLYETTTNPTRKLMQHKYAEDLKVGDRIDIAGNHCDILETYEVVDSEVIKIAYSLWNGSRRYVMTAPRRLTMILVNK